MKVFDIKLNEKYPFLDKNGAKPYVTAMLQLEVYKIEGQEFYFKRPAMIVCPGGGYQALSAREAEPIALHFLKLGFNVFVLYYSVRPHTFPQAIRELAATVDMIHKNAEEWNIDTSKIAVTGYSAGGHLAASYCTMRNCKEVSEVISAKPVAAAVLGYPVITADPETTNHPTIKNLTASKEFTDEIVEKFSLEKHVSKELTPPTFIWHTATDEMVPVDNSLLYASALRKAGVDFELHIFPKGRHGLATCDIQTNFDYNEEFNTTAHNWISYCDRWIKSLFNI